MKGIKDIVKEQRWSTRHLMDELEKSKVPGNWNIHQNIYNLVSGKFRPKDPGVYVVLSRLFDISLEEMISRYSDVDFTPQSTDDKNEEVIIENKTINW
jgi:hypothetical protein